jgi:hypothetical protein
MPKNNKNNKRNNSKNKTNTKRNRKNRNNNNRIRRQNNLMQGAPVGVSEDLQQFTRFMPGSKVGSLRIHTCAAICEVLRVSASAQGNALLFPAGIGAISAQLNLTEPATLSSAGTKVIADYTSPVFDLISSCFVRYRLNKLVFHYEPQAAATTSERLVFAFAQDPVHPVLWNATVPTQNELLALSDSIAFAPWRAWSMDCTSSVADTLMYTFTEDSTVVGSFVERFSDFGVISCVSNTGSGVTTSCGVLYMEADIELLEFCPISLVSPASAKRLSFRLSSSVQKPEYKLPSSSSSSSSSSSPKEKLFRKKCSSCGDKGKWFTALAHESFMKKPLVLDGFDCRKDCLVCKKKDVIFHESKEISLDQSSN